MARALRVIVMRDGKVIDDRPIEGGIAVSVGTAAQNTFRLTGSGVPESTTLLHHDGESPVLHVLDGMRGELALDGVTPAPLSNAGPERTVTLSESTRGWVSIGSTTFFLQQPSIPASKPKNVLPKEVRGGWLSGIESRFALVLIGVLSLEGIGVAAISRRPDVEPEPPVAVPGIGGTVVRVPIIEDPPLKRAPERSSEKPQSGHGSSTAKPAANKAPTAAQQAHQAVLDILGGGASGDPLDRIVNHNASNLEGLEEALKTAVPKVASTSETFGPRRRDGSSGVVDADDPAGDPFGPKRRPIALPPKNPPPPVVILDPLDPPVHPPGFEPEDLVKFIKRHMGAIKFCYDRELKSEPTLHGRISIRFTLASTGRLTDITVEKNTLETEAVGSCIVRLMSGWLMTSRPEEDVTVTFPFVFAPGG
jgi:hypothetical protein